MELLFFGNFELTFWKIIIPLKNDKNLKIKIIYQKKFIFTTIVWVSWIETRKKNHIIYYYTWELVVYDFLFYNRW